MMAYFCGCSTLYTGIVTLTEVRQSAMKELALAYKQGLIDEETDAKIEAADAAYHKSRIAAIVALKAWQVGGEQGDYLKAVELVRDNVGALLDIVALFVSDQKINQLEINLAKANFP